MAETSGSKTWMMLISAVLFGLVAAGLSVLYLNAREAAIIESLIGEEEVLMKVIVANRDLPKGTRLKEEYLATLNMPAKFVADSTLTLNNLDDHLDQFLINDITAGKPVLAGDIDPKFPRDFSDLIDAGHRALTVQVDEVNSISGMLRPGNNVDIYVIIQAKITGYKPTSTTATSTTAAAIPTALADSAIKAAQAAGLPEGIDLPIGLLSNQVAVQEKPKDIIIPVAQDVRVLAAGQEAYKAYLDQYQLPQQRAEAGFAAVTLDVTPKQAALLALADDKGDLVAILRNRDDRSLADFDGITPFDLVREAAKMKELAALKKAAAAAGMTIDENGNYVDADGNVVDPDDIVVNADGTITTKQAIMEAAGYTLNENGEYVDKNGNVVDPDDIVVNADGTITTKQAIMEAAGYTQNEDGQWVDKDGNVVDPDDIVVLANGTVMTKGGKIISGPKALEALLGRGAIRLIIGGSSKDGKAKRVNLPIESIDQPLSGDEDNGE